MIINIISDRLLYRDMVRSSVAIRYRIVVDHNENLSQVTSVMHKKTCITPPQSTGVNWYIFNYFDPEEKSVTLLVLTFGSQRMVSTSSA